MQYLKRLSRTTAVVLGFMGAMLTATVALAQGTDSNVTVTNNVSLSFTVNTIPQTANASTDFLVDRKLIVDVATVDTNWVTVVAGQTTGAPATGVPAMNFDVTNLSNGTENVIVGLIDQDLTQVQTFSAIGATLFNPTAIVVARDTNGNQAYDDGVDTIIPPTTVGGSIYDLGNLAEDEVVSLVVAADVPAVADAYATYTLVAAVASGGAALPNDNSGNGAPGAGPPPASTPNNINGVADLVFADDDAAPPANVEDEQFDFFVAGGGPAGGLDVAFNGQNSDSSGMVTGSTLALAKYVEVIYDPVVGNRYDNTGAVIAEPKSIPGAVLMYVIGLANESAALDAAGVTISDDIPDGVPDEVVDEGNQSGFAGPIELPVNVSFNVGTGTPSFGVGAASNLDEVYSEGCADPGTSIPYNGAGVVLGGNDSANPEFSVSVGTCAATDTAFVVYFVTIN